MEYNVGHFIEEFSADFNSERSRMKLSLKKKKKPRKRSPKRQQTLYNKHSGHVCQRKSQRAKFSLCTVVI